MVVGAYVELRVVLAVLPAHDFAGRHRARIVLRAGHSLALAHLCQQPAAGDYGMGAQQLGRRRGAHLRRDDAAQIRLHAQAVDYYDAALGGAQRQRSGKLLVLAALPVEVDAYHHVLHLEHGIVRLGLERHFFGQTLETHGAAHSLAVAAAVAAAEVYLHGRSREYAHGHPGLCCILNAHFLLSMIFLRCQDKVLRTRAQAATRPRARNPRGAV